MGVDISHIVKHDFRHVEDKKESMDFVKHTIECLQKKLLIPNGCNFDLRVHNEEGNDITFLLPLYNLVFELHNGFWQIESCFHYCQIVMHFDGVFWLRRKIFDIAKALGQNEAWYAEEFYTWNGGGCENPEITFEEWIEFTIKQYGNLFPEFDQQQILAQRDVQIPDYEPLYHDSFKECEQLYDEIQSKFWDYRLLGLYPLGKFLRCEKDSQLFLINEETLKPLFNEPVEEVTSMDGRDFAVKKDGLSAVFDCDGQQLTNFVKGQWTFEYKWNEEDKLLYKRIYNEAGNELCRQIK